MNLEIMGIIDNIFDKKTRFLKVGLLLFVTLLSTSNIHANNGQKITKDPSLVAFYNDVFKNDPKIVRPKLNQKKQSVKKKQKRVSENCISYPPGSEHEFALDLKRKREQQNLRLLMSDVKITKQTNHVKDEINRLKNIDTEIFFDLVQNGNNEAQMNLGVRKVRCRKKVSAKPIIKIPDPKENLPKQIKPIVEKPKTIHSNSNKG